MAYTVTKGINTFFRLVFVFFPLFLLSLERVYRLLLQFLPWLNSIKTLDSLQQKGSKNKHESGIHMLESPAETAGEIYFWHFGKIPHQTQNTTLTSNTILPSLH